MSDPSVAIQIALINRLQALDTDAGTRVYGQIQSGTLVYPYIMVWTGEMVPIDEECWDRSETVLQIDVWSDAPGFEAVKTVAGAIRDALHEGDLTVSGHVVDRMRVQSMNFSVEATHYRARLSLSIETQPAA